MHYHVVNNMLRPMVAPSRQGGPTLHVQDNQTGTLMAARVARPRDTTPVGCDRVTLFIPRSVQAQTWARLAGGAIVLEPPHPAAGPALARPSLLGTVRDGVCDMARDMARGAHAVAAWLFGATQTGAQHLMAGVVFGVVIGALALSVVALSQALAEALMVLTSSGAAGLVAIAFVLMLLCDDLHRARA